MTKIITVGLAPRAYAIHVGNGLWPSRALLKPFARGTVPVVTDAHVARFIWRPFGRAGQGGVWRAAPS